MAGVNLDIVKEEHVREALDWLADVQDYGGIGKYKRFILFKGREIPLKLVVSVAYRFAEKSKPKIGVIQGYTTLQMISVLEKLGGADKFGYTTAIKEIDGEPGSEPITSTAADRSSIEVTVYNDDIGLIKERRTVKAAAGEGELRFSDIAARINPVTVHIMPLPDAKDFAVLEQNYEYDLISHNKILDKYVGKEIKIIDANEYQDRKDVVSATLLSLTKSSEYTVDEVYKIGGEIYLGHPGIKVLPELPGNLISRPTLSWIYRSRAARDYDIEVSYLTEGMEWNADYVLFVADGKAAGGLSGWVTVNNRSGAEYADAKLKLVAGEINGMSRRRENLNRMVLEAPRRRDEDDDSNDGFAESAMFDYHIYDLGRPVTIKQNQAKQISLLEVHGVNVIKQYTVNTALGNYYYLNSLTENGAEQMPVSVHLMFKNAKNNGLGIPLPAGTIRIYTADVKGSRQYIGEDRIAHTPKDEEIRLKAGEAFDIVAERKQVSFVQRTPSIAVTEWKIALRNRKEEDITVRVQEEATGVWEVQETSHKCVAVNASTFRFDVPVPKGKEVEVKYKIRVERV
jgi:hypothetical protein